MIVIHNAHYRFTSISILLLRRYRTIFLLVGQSIQQRSAFRIHPIFLVLFFEIGTRRKTIGFLREIFRDDWRVKCHTTKEEERGSPGRYAIGDKEIEIEIENERDKKKSTNVHLYIWIRWHQLHPLSFVRFFNVEWQCQSRYVIPLSFRDDSFPSISHQSVRLGTGCRQMMSQGTKQYNHSIEAFQCYTIVFGLRFSFLTLFPLLNWNSENSWRILCCCCCCFSFQPQHLPSRHCLVTLKKGSLSILIDSRTPWPLSCFSPFFIASSLFGELVNTLGFLLNIRPCVKFEWEEIVERKLSKFVPPGTANDQEGIPMRRDSNRFSSTTLTRLHKLFNSSQPTIKIQTCC